MDDKKLSIIDMNDNPIVFEKVFTVTGIIGLVSLSAAYLLQVLSKGRSR